jgi:hypothetical protein
LTPGGRRQGKTGKDSERHGKRQGKTGKGIGNPGDRERQGERGIHVSVRLRNPPRGLTQLPLCLAPAPRSRRERAGRQAGRQAGKQARKDTDRTLRFQCGGPLQKHVAQQLRRTAKGTNMEPNNCQQLLGAAAVRDIRGHRTSRSRSRRRRQTTRQ